MSEKSFVERRFEHDGSALVCRFFEPTLEPGGEYACVWTIGWKDREQRLKARGIDGVQALLLAMRSVHSELVESDAYKAGRLTFLEEGDLGLPPPWEPYVPEN